MHKNNRKVLISIFVAIILTITVSGCKKEPINIIEDPLNTPYSLGPTTPPSVEIPSTNPPQ